MKLYDNLINRLLKTMSIKVDIIPVSELLRNQ
nr:MAG TPA: hypothetical protein [Caudoviricetes sp.]